MNYNKVISYIDAHTGETRGEDFFLDSEMHWFKDKLGNVLLYTLYGGQPTEEWLKANPKPR